MLTAPPTPFWEHPLVKELVAEAAQVERDAVAARLRALIVAYPDDLRALAECIEHLADALSPPAKTPEE